MQLKYRLMMATCTAVFAILGAAVVSAADEDKYSLVSPSGIAFGDFMGYEDWAVVSSARTDKELKVIVANPIMIKAYKAGVPGNGRPRRFHGRLDREPSADIGLAVIADTNPILDHSPRRAVKPR